jgi:subtilisin family serine protease
MDSSSRGTTALALLTLGCGLTLSLGTVQTTNRPDAGHAARSSAATPLATRTGTPAAARLATPSAPPPVLPAVAEGATAVPGELIVTLDGADAAAIAPVLRSMGAHIIDQTADGKALRLALQDGTEPEAVADQLAQVPGVAHAGPNGIIRGASTELRRMQWHLDEVYSLDTSANQNTVTVAVFDTGLAVGYHACREAMGDLIPTGTAVDGIHVPVHPDRTPRGHDFWNGRPCPVDDHQHGTHIASLIGSTDALTDGVAPGVNILPVKVLGSDNQGHEFGLLTALQAFSQALDAEQSALLGRARPKVLNMSLSFAPDYTPSPALQHWLHTINGQGVLVVAAAGNDGIDQVSWPAAHPDVLAVGSVCLDEQASWERAPYSNAGPAIDLVAPGGCLDRDVNEDGLPDGLLAESIDTSDRKPGLWQMAGTSQAAALVSGAAAAVLADWPDASPDAVRWVLQTTAKDLGEGDWRAGMGAGLVHVSLATTLAQTRPVPSDFERSSVAVGLLPMLIDNGDGTVSPSARVAAFTASGNIDKTAQLLVRINGPSSALVICDATEWKDNVCVVEAPAVDDDGSSPLAWSVSVPQARVDHATVPTHPVLFASDDLDDALGAMAEAGLGGVPFGFFFDTLDALPSDGGLWNAQHGSVSIVNTGTGLASSPMGIVGNPQFLANMGSMAGSGDLAVTMRTVDGTGLASSPMGLQLLDLHGGAGPLALLDGTGLASSPMGLQQILMNEGVGCGSCSLDGLMVAPDQELLGGQEAAVLPFLATRIAGTAQLTALGLDPATTLAASVDTGAVSAVGQGTGAVPFVDPASQSQGGGKTSSKK